MGLGDLIEAERALGIDPPNLGNKRRTMTELVFTSRADEIKAQKGGAFSVLRKNLEKRIARGGEVKAEFLQNLEKSLVYALQWGDSFFEASAKAQVAQDLLTSLDNWLTQGKSVEAVEKWLLDFAHEETIKRAKDRHSSTSTSRNLLEDVLRVAWADVLERLPLMMIYEA